MSLFVVMLVEAAAWHSQTEGWMQGPHVVHPCCRCLERPRNAELLGLDVDSLVIAHVHGNRAP